VSSSIRQEPGNARPPRLARGQTIGVPTPAGPIRRERLEAGLARLVAVAGDVRIRVGSVATTARAPGVPSYLAASDQERLDELSQMIADPDVRAIILARGGYGLMRILPRLDLDLLRRDPKPIVGFSDATALLAWAHAAGVRAIHGPVIAQLGDLPDTDVAALMEALTDPAPPPPWSLEPRGHGVHAGPLVASNLTLASMLIGTPWPVPLAGAIVVLEEVGERPYEIDRYLTQLVLTGALPAARAAVVGDLTRCHDPSPPSGERDPEHAALDVVLERLAYAGLPAAERGPS
jgi:muramoyltetrapeptide carboxypeptidase